MAVEWRSWTPPPARIMQKWIGLPNAEMVAVGGFEPPTKGL